MSKITFRADDDLVGELERFDASKSEVLREALRTYLERGADEHVGGAGPRGRDHQASEPTGDGFDELIREVVRDEVEVLLERRSIGDGRDVNVNVSLEESPDVNADSRQGDGEQAADRQQAMPDGTHGYERKTEATEANAERDGTHQCGQCGHEVDDGHVYCPNCGEKATRRVFCECGEEIHSDWSFCPGCGRRTPAADVLESR